jgi:hypothetical protein
MNRVIKLDFTGQPPKAGEIARNVIRVSDVKNNLTVK